MNILFLSLIDFSSFEEKGIYTDLLREFAKNGHKVYAISPVEKKKKAKTHMIEEMRYKILKLRIGNIQKVNLLEKLISTLTLEKNMICAVERYFNDTKFDLIIYSTPPITFQKVVEYVKNRDGAKAYLLLKDIFPQNAVDLGLISKSGISSFAYKYFRKKEKLLYEISDYIGCMSNANVRYLLTNNKKISSQKVEVCPNSIELLSNEKNDISLESIKFKYDIPLNKVLFVYGGNLGKPQGVDFLLKCIKRNEEKQNSYFLIIGSGAEYNKISKFFKKEKILNAKLFELMDKNAYNEVLTCCDVGLIFLDYRFTIPNFPSRLLSYMQAAKPVLAATDCNTDIGQVIEKNKFGCWCESNSVEKFSALVTKLCNKELLVDMGKNSMEYLKNNYTSEHTYKIIMKHFE